MTGDNRHREPGEAPGSYFIPGALKDYAAETVLR